LTEAVLAAGGLAFRSFTVVRNRGEPFGFVWGWLLVRPSGDDKLVVRGFDGIIII
jgi:hypothetical protein